VAKSVYGEKKKQQKRGRRERNDKKKDEFDQRILDIARVTRVMAGGKRMSFRACVAIGDKKGKVATALGKGSDVSIAINKAVNKAKKDMMTVSMINETIPHEVYHQLGAAKILFKPAKQGRGVIAGGVVRIILELAGVKNISSKILGTNNKINNARCTIEALRKLKKVEDKKQTQDKNKTAEKKSSDDNKDKKTDSNQSK
jgi:small subunit ribosomal protein S5